MSQFSGSQGTGAMRRRREVKREQAEERQRRAIFSIHGDKPCDCKANEKRHTTSTAGPTI